MLDHQVKWTAKDGWGAPLICEYHDLALSPATPALHYAIQVFEGLKAYKDAAGKVELKSVLLADKFSEHC